ncbi:MAG: membrane-bound PQQ-dependent dehydrogenase, glucose/quinate/shikimate family [Pseudomonadota bacterium]
MPSEARAKGGFVSIAARAVTVILLLAAGLGMVVPGLYLARLGGSVYYAIAGLAVVVAAILVLLRRRDGIHLYGVVFLGTVIWSLCEVGVDGWALMPRVVFLAVAGAWLLLPAVGACLQPSGRYVSLAGRAASIAAIGLLIAVSAANAIGIDRGAGQSFAVESKPEPADAGAWTHYGGDLSGARYSPLSEITPRNAASIEQAWVYHAGLYGPDGARRGNLEVTPLMADGAIYGCTAFSSVFALDPVTGKEIWRHDPKLDQDNLARTVCRGVTFFRAPKGVADCPTRLLLGTADNHLIALDAKTGRPCAGFGAGGAVNLRDGLGDLPARWTSPSSPPTIVNGVAVIGAFVADNQSIDVPPGVVRGYDAVTGALKWAFDPGRPDRRKLLAPGETYTPSTPNAWTVFSGDEALGLVFVPMGNGSPDFLGGHRTPETDRFSTSLVALDAATGAVRWTFQAVHHDLWDYDLAAQPVLADFPIGATTAPAVFVPTKTGQVFVLDRRTGAPLTKVEERTVPASDLPGERASPTQPFSVEMPDFVGPQLTEADMWGLTPFDQVYCRIKFREARYDGIFTTPRLGPTIRLPGELGGIDWGSVAVDEARAVMIVNSNRMADYDQLIPRAQADAEGLVPRMGPPKPGAPRPPPGAAMAGTPYAVHWKGFLTPLDVPCQRPPYGMLTAVDLKTRKVIWARPLGDSRNSGPWGVPTLLPIPLGAPNIGGSIVTGGGLIFIAATQDEMFRAIDLASGKTVWQVRLPAAGNATPMTYKGADGRQYVLIAAGGQSIRTKPGDAFVAFRLKR